MRMFKTLLTIFVLQVSAMALYGRGSETTSFSGVNTPIPDGTATGIQDVRSITSEIVELTAVRIRLKISGNFNARGLLFTTMSGQPTLLFSNTKDPGHNILKAGPGDVVPQ